MGLFPKEYIKMAGDFLPDNPDGSKSARYYTLYSTDERHQELAELLGWDEDYCLEWHSTLQHTSLNRPILSPLKCLKTSSPMMSPTI